MHLRVPIYWARALVQWLWGEAHVPEVVGANPAPFTGWTFFTFICCKNCNHFCLKRPKINEKEAGVGPSFKRVPISKFIPHLNLGLNLLLQCLPLNIAQTRLQWEQQQKTFFEIKSILNIKVRENVFYFIQQSLAGGQ